MEGVYLLLINLKKPLVKTIGALGEIEFKEGNYIYTGSAQNNLEARVSRHLSSEKTKHWHIDYLLEEAEILEAIAFEAGKEKECESALSLDKNKQFTRVEDFGCSDCSCPSHLYFSDESVEVLLDKMTGLIEEEPVKSEDLDL